MGTQPRTLEGLVCDDDPAARSAVLAVLERCGFAASAADSADAAMTAATTRQPDVVVLDLAVSGDRGVRLITALRDAAPDCTVVVLTAFMALRQAALDAGARAVLDHSDLRELEPCLLDVARRRSGPPALDPQARST